MPTLTGVPRFVRFIQRVVVRYSMLVIFVVSAILLIMYLSYQWNSIFVKSPVQSSFFQISLENSNDIINLQSNVVVKKGIRIRASNNYLSSSIILPQEYNLSVYITALYNSVKVMTIPFTSTHQKAISDCRTIKKTPLFKNQHSLELRFPIVLSEMLEISKRFYGHIYGLRFGFQWQNTTAKHKDLKGSQYNEPLFYFLKSYEYFVVHCTYKAKGRNGRTENWREGAKYLEEIADIVVTYDEWQENMGIDFLSPASHPKSGPFPVDPTSLNLFRRQTFLRTDFDFTGSTPKDIIVPYYTSLYDEAYLTSLINSDADAKGGDGTENGRNTSSLSLSKTSATTKSNKKRLIFFAGGENPPEGLRSLMEMNFLTLIRSGLYRNENIFYTMDHLSLLDYVKNLLQSEFCLTIRGDTASSSRLFSIISAGCIPVIISDWMHLPFESIIDYSKFTVRFPESIVHNVDLLVRELLLISPERRAIMRRALSEAKTMLLYEPSRTEYFLLNPISLSLIEMFQRRLVYCNQLSERKSSTMCMKLYQRLSFAIKYNQELESKYDFKRFRDNLLL